MYWAGGWLAKVLEVVGENFAEIRRNALAVLPNDLLAQLRTFVRASAGVADQSRRIANHADWLMSVPRQAQQANDGQQVAEVQRVARRIEAGIDALSLTQRNPRFLFARLREDLLQQATSLQLRQRLTCQSPSETGRLLPPLVRGQARQQAKHDDDTDAGAAVERGAIPQLTLGHAWSLEHLLWTASSGAREWSARVERESELASL